MPSRPTEEQAAGFANRFRDGARACFYLAYSDGSRDDGDPRHCKLLGDRKRQAADGG
ncbi:hypothetical protein RBSH_05970 [Rhodopirellula baltica SH28]|uniref:Uncharacterized protein n=2 Tax=Rhodopirellula TaxID=265488 RepID=M5SM84_9BACT|nr:hypothetical protein RBSH_05970 [Rhodopirellula baltica SH28]EMI27334.1 hypothetical protein RESH_02066 [Rhodopirellula europaea SH398]